MDSRVIPPSDPPRIRDRPCRRAGGTACPSQPEALSRPPAGRRHPRISKGPPAIARPRRHPKRMPKSMITPSNRSVDAASSTPPRRTRRSWPHASAEPSTRETPARTIPARPRAGAASCRPAIQPRSLCVHRAYAYRSTPRAAAAQSSSTISNDLTPRGAFTLTVSPTRDFINASPIGLLAVTST